MSHDDETPAPDVVDFDALHAALGDLPPPPTSSSPSIGESQGRSSATYSSSRPHTIPPTRAPVADELNAPPVIVQTEDTVPTGPPQQMTVPMAGAPAYGGPGSSAPIPVARPPTPPHPFTPEPFAAAAAPQGVGPDQVRTLPMGAPRRPRTPTIVVRTRGPTKQQKLLVFMAMLLVFVAGGIAFLVYGKQLGLDIDLDLKPPRPTSTTPGTQTATAATALTPSANASAPVSATAATAATATATATATASVTPSSLPVAPATASAKKPPRRAAPPPQPPP